MTILATIHQPSADLLFMFDRIILMSEGYMIYNGPPREAGDFFSQFGLVLKQNCNPADKLLSIASNPRRNLDQNITIKEISKQLRHQHLDKFRLAEDHPMRTELQTLDSINKAGEVRNVSSCKQFLLLLQRMFIQVYRIPVAGLALIIMAVFVGVMQASLFSKVGSQNYLLNDPQNNRKVTINFLGLAFLTGQD